MKWMILVLLIIVLENIVSAQIGKVGINTTNPAAMLHVKDSSVVFTGGALFPLMPGSPPVNGSGIKMMWYPDKAAFRAGILSAGNADYWNKENIGNNSIAMGSNTKASKVGSVAMGSETRAMGDYATAFGYLTEASGIGSTALGMGTTASGNNGSLTAGSSTNAMGSASAAFGHFNSASGDNSSVFGFDNKSKSYCSFVIGNFNDDMTVGSPTSINPGNRLFQIGNGTASNARSNAMTVLHNGNIGIGMTNPGFPLNFPTTLGDKISLWGSAGNHYGFGVQGALLQIHSDASTSDVAFGYGSSGSFTETMRIKGNGNVGIGTTSPTVLLHVSKNTNYGIGSTYGIAAANSTDTNLRLGLGYDAVIDAGVIQAIHEGNTFNKKLFLNPNGGNVGIGNITADYLLDVGGRVRIRNGGETAGVWFNKNDNASKAGFIGTHDNDNNIGLYGATGAGWAFLMNTTNGNIGLGTDNPGVKLTVVGDGYFSGSVTATCGMFNCSDIRYKKNIFPITNALTSLQFIHGIYYNWDDEKFRDKNFGDDRQIGFSAQELEEVYPEMVHTDSEGFKTVDYSRLTPVLVEAIKEQQSQIDILKSELDQLKEIVIAMSRSGN